MQPTKHTNKKRKGEGDYEASERYQNAATKHAKSGASESAARQAARDRDADAAALDAAEDAGRARARGEDASLRSPTWWTETHGGVWDRMRAALRRDWEQTKRDLSSSSGEELDQSALDTLRQIATDDPIPAEGMPADKPDGWQERRLLAQAAFADGHDSDGAWDDAAERRTKAAWQRADTSVAWPEARGLMQASWYAGHRWRSSVSPGLRPEG